MSDSTGLRQRLREMLLERSVRRGDFLLASGRRSSFYIDARQTTMSGEGLVVIGALGLERLAARGGQRQLIGGLRLRARPGAYARAAAGRGRGRPRAPVTVREGPKDH